MCSITDQRLAMIGTAIDELAETARAEAAQPRARGTGAGTPDTMAERLAGIWAMVADLDPGLAHRLAQYTGQPTTGQPTTGQPTTGQPSQAPDTHSRRAPPLTARGDLRAQNYSPVRSR